MGYVDDPSSGDEDSAKPEVQVVEVNSHLKTLAQDNVDFNSTDSDGDEYGNGNGAGGYGNGQGGNYGGKGRNAPPTP